jgi:hypothetical protein
MIDAAFLFLNEPELLEMRLHTPAPCVDRFILVEANQTFSTLSRKGGFIFEKNRDAFPAFIRENRERDRERIHHPGAAEFP